MSQEKGMSEEKLTAGELEQIAEEAYEAVSQLLDAAGLKSGDILVAGCSTSEIEKHRIGSYSNKEVGEAVFAGIQRALVPRGIYLAAQCCEHLNRAIIIEEEAADRYHLERVNVVPMPKAGGAFATAAYRGFVHPAAVEEVSADAGIDIGDTLIGMHLKRVAVPVRTERKNVGSAHVVCARTRYKFVGGSRAHYDEELL